MSCSGEFIILYIVFWVVLLLPWYIKFYIYPKFKKLNNDK